MTIQQKDALTNKIMVYISIAFGETILWYVIFSLIKSSLYTAGYITLVVCAAILILFGSFLWIRYHYIKSQNTGSYIRTCYIAALFCLFMCIPVVLYKFNLSAKIPSIPYLTEALTSRVYNCYFAIIVSYICLTIAVLVNTFMMIFHKTETEKITKHN